MSVKRLVSTRFWQDGTVVDQYTPNDKYFMLYLLTNPRTRQCGIYLLPKKYIAFEMGLSLDVVLSLLKKFEKEYRNIIYDDKTQEVAVLNAMKHNIITGGTPVSDLIRKELSTIQSSRLIQAVFDNMKDHWEASARKIDKDVLALFDDEISRRHVECKLNENENENEKSYGDTAHVLSHESSDVSSRKKTSKKQLNKVQDAQFDAFWASYPKKVGKQPARKAWDKLDPDKVLFEKIKASIETQKKSEQWTKDGGVFIPNPSTWINQARWDDVLPTGNGGRSPFRGRIVGDNRYYLPEDEQEKLDKEFRYDVRMPRLDPEDPA